MTIDRCPAVQIQITLQLAFALFVYASSPVTLIPPGIMPEFYELLSLSMAVVVELDILSDHSTGQSPFHCIFPRQVYFFRYVFYYDNKFMYIAKI